MKFQIQKDLLLEALQRVSNVVEKKNSLQILSNVMMEVNANKLTLTATDLEVGIKISVPVQADKEGKVAVSAKNLLDIVKELPNKSIHLNKKDNNWIELSCHKSNFNIVGLAADEFPPMPAFEDKNYFKVNVASAREMIDKTLFAVSTDETRYHLNGAYMEAIENNMIRMVATDGHRLAYMDKELVLNQAERFKKGIIIPKKGLLEMRRLLDTKADAFNMDVEKGNLLIQMENVSLFVRLIEGSYPDYEQVVPKNNTKIMTVSRDELLGSLKRVSLLANEKSKGVKFTLSQNQLTITSSNSDLGDAKEELDVKFDADNMEIGFNAKYIIDCLGILETENVSFHLNDKSTAGLMRPEGKDDYTYIVMPMRI